MKKVEISIEQTGVLAGLVITVLLIIYFFLMRIFNISGSAIAWSFNFIILFSGLTFTYKYYRTKSKPNIDYLPGLWLGSLTTSICAGLYTVFIYLFLSVIDPGMLVLLKDNILFMGEQITPFRASTATLIEGICSGFIISFLVMQYYKSGFKRVLGEKAQA